MDSKIKLIIDSSMIPLGCYQFIQAQSFDDRMNLDNAGLHVTLENTNDAQAADFDLAIAVNLRGVWNCHKHELKKQRKQGGSTIVNCFPNSGVVLRFSSEQAGFDRSGYHR